MVYEVLLKNGPLVAGKLTKKTPLKRGLVYKLLEQLVELGLVEKEEKEGKSALFKPGHPLKLKELAQNQEKKAKDAQMILAGVLGGLVSDFNLVSGKPGIRFFEGVEGLKEVYDDILETGENFYLVRSIYEPVYSKQILPVVNKFIKKRVERGISVIGLTPRDYLGKRKPTPEDDAKILYQRIWINKKDYDVPVEIDIYGNKVAFLSFGKELIGVIIESEQISQSLKKLFLLARRTVKQPAEPSSPKEPHSDLQSDDE